MDPLAFACILHKEKSMKKIIIFGFLESESDSDEESRSGSDSEEDDEEKDHSKSESEVSTKTGIISTQDCLSVVDWHPIQGLSNTPSPFIIEKLDHRETRV